MFEMLKQLFSLLDKVALITGGGRGIGQETALMLGQAGAKLAVLIVTKAPQEIRPTKLPWQAAKHSFSWPLSRSPSR